jgi:hypothetical protein
MTSPINPYQGINAHLNSLLQTPGTPQQPALFASFHVRFVVRLCDALNAILPTNYVAFAEQSLQIRGGDEQLLLQRPDVLIVQDTPSETLAPAVSRQPTLELLIPETIAPDDFLTAITIREIDDQSPFGKLVTRLEFLSPANKPAGSGAAAYQTKRVQALQSGVPLIEIDFVHEQLSPLFGTPNYPRDPAAYPYYIAVSDPRPHWQTGRVKFYGFHVNEPILPIDVPLAHTEQIHLELEAVYQHVFEAGRWYKYVDYSQPPARFDTYSRLDRTRIVQVMAQAI